MSKKKQSIALVVLSLLLSSTAVYAQELNDKKFLFASEKIKLSTFFVEIAPSTAFSQLNGQGASISVFSAGFILNDKFSVSFFSASSPKVNVIPIPEPGSEKYMDWIEAGVKLEKLPSSQELVYLNFNHSGLRFDYMNRTDRVLFWRAGLSFGFLGGLTLSERQTFLGLFNNVIYDEAVMTIEPDIYLGVNLLSWWRIYAGFGYRLMGADTRIMSAADTDSFNFSLSFAFGKFGK